MGREVRMVPPDWQHPRDGYSRNNRGELAFRPLHNYADYEQRRVEWEAVFAEKGLQATLDYHGTPPDLEEYMPKFPEGTATHYMMYETCSEGTPISPAFETPEALARWLADTEASAFGERTASYEAWLEVALGVRAPSCVLSPELGLISGVEALTGGSR